MEALSLNPYSLALFILAFVEIILIVYAWQRRSATGAVAYVLLMSASAIYTMGYALELSSFTLSAMLLWVKIEYLGVSTATAFWLILVIQYAGHDKWLTRINLMLLFLIPAITLILNYTNQFHHLYYRSLTVAADGPFPMVDVSPGPWYWIHTVFIQVTILFGIILLIQKLTNASGLYRRQIVILLIGASAPWLAYLLYLFKLTPLAHLDPTPFALWITGLFSAWGLYGYRLFDIVPVARDHVIDNLKDGVLVVDNQCRLVDCNQSASLIFGWNEPPLGKNLVETFVKCPGLAALCNDETSQTIEFPHTSAGETRLFEGSVSILRDRHNRDMGRILLIHDISERKQIENTLRQAIDEAEAVNLELKKASERQEQMAITDTLTGIFNRWKFTEVMAYEIDRVKRNDTQLSLIMFDLDRLKSVNDLYGHHVGDAALVDLVEIVKGSIRKADLFFRWGGDEFIILAPGVSGDGTVALAEKIRTRVEQHLFANIERLTISMGVIEIQSTDNMDGLLKRVDRALYRAKQNGRNRVEFETLYNPPP